MKAIKTTVYGPTNINGTRISATDEDGNRVILNWDHSMGGQGNSRKAAETLLKKMNWKGRWIGGALKNHYVWVCIPTIPSWANKESKRLIKADMLDIR